MSKEGSVAPKERINVIFKPDTNDGDLNKELPLKMMVLGDFSGKQDDRSIEDRQTININKDNLDDVMQQQNISIDLNLRNRLNENNEDLLVNLSIDKIKDFSPDSIVDQVPELKKLMVLRKALEALKGPLGNVPAFRKSIENILQDQESRDQLLKELDLITD